MFKLFQVAWFLIPAGVLAFHYGPGQEYLARDKADSRFEQGLDARDAESFGEAGGHFGLAVSLLPKSDIETQRSLKLAQAANELADGSILEAQEKLHALLHELEEADLGEEELARNARHLLGKASYFAAWIMRLEGASAEEWKPEIQRAQQNYRLLAERAEERADASEERLMRENLEAAVRLEQMDLEALLALPLPKDCNCNCESLSQRKRKQCAGKCKGKGKKEGDARKKVKQAMGAGLNSRQGGGS